MFSQREGPASEPLETSNTYQCEHRLPFLRDSTPGKQTILHCVSESIRHSHTHTRVCLLMLRGVHTDPWVVLPLIGPETHMLEIGSKHKHQTVSQWLRHDSDRIKTPVTSQAFCEARRFAEYQSMWDGGL